MYELNSLKQARTPAVLRAVQHHQLMSAYGLAPAQIDAMPHRDVQLLRYCLQAEGKAAREGEKKRQFYSEAGVTPASGARF